MNALCNILIAISTTLAPTNRETRFTEVDADSISIGANFATVVAKIGLPGDYRTRLTTYPEPVSAIALLASSCVWYGDRGMIRIWFDANNRVRQIYHLPSD